MICMYVMVCIKSIIFQKENEFIMIRVHLFSNSAKLIPYPSSCYFIIILSTRRRPLLNIGLPHTLPFHLTSSQYLLTNQKLKQFSTNLQRYPEGVRNSSHLSASRPVTLILPQPTGPSCKWQPQPKFRVGRESRVTRYSRERERICQSSYCER